MTWPGWRTWMLLAAMATCASAWGQARREGIPGVGAGTVWFDDLDDALTAHRAGTPVVALDLTRDKLQTLPQGLVELTALRVLMLHKNRLSDLPPWLAEMEALQVLLLDQNRFDAFPDVLLRMDRLETLSLGGQLHRRDSVGRGPHGVAAPFGLVGQPDWTVSRLVGRLAQLAHPGLAPQRHDRRRTRTRFEHVAPGEGADVRALPL